VRDFRRFVQAARKATGYANYGRRTAWESLAFIQDLVVFALSQQPRWQVGFIDDQLKHLGLPMLGFRRRSKAKNKDLRYEKHLMTKIGVRIRRYLEKARAFGRSQNFPCVFVRLPLLRGCPATSETAVCRVATIVCPFRRRIPIDAPNFPGFLVKDGLL
jgi:hypothetical protein